MNDKGKIIGVSGPVVDVEFENGILPNIENIESKD